MTWLSNRLAEPSTRIALGFAALIIQQLIAHPPATVQDWLGFAMGLAGAAGGFATKSPGAPDNPAPVPLAVQSLR